MDITPAATNKAQNPGRRSAPVTFRALPASTTTRCTFSVTRGRAGGVAAAAGWMLAVVLLTASRPEGDFLFAAGAGSYLFLLGGIGVAVICATLAPRRQPDGDPVRLGK